MNYYLAPGHYVNLDSSVGTLFKNNTRKCFTPGCYVAVNPLVAMVTAIHDYYSSSV